MSLWIYFCHKLVVTWTMNRSMNISSEADTTLTLVHSNVHGWFTSKFILIEVHTNIHTRLMKVQREVHMQHFNFIFYFNEQSESGVSVAFNAIVILALISSLCRILFLLLLPLPFLVRISISPPHWEQHSGKQSFSSSPLAISSQCITLSELKYQSPT